ncbi:MAG: MBL fold metallo-hydrolase [Phycisphaeraceae bacterium]|nr:MBL fold metallo-hydrolase [Phycisphaeraceae bacterium]
MAIWTTLRPHLHRVVCRGRGTQYPACGYVLDRGDHSIAIDPGAEVTPAAVAKLGLPPVKHVLVTHVQREHAAGCEALAAGGAAIHVPAGDEYLMEGELAYRALMTRWVAPWDWEMRGNFKGHLAGAANERPVHRAVKLDSSLTPAPGSCCEGIQILATPGHGKHAVTLIATLNHQRVAFCGDLVCDDGKLWNGFDCDWDYGLETGQKTLLASARSLMEQPMDLLCPAHGEMIDQPREALANLIRRLESVLQHGDQQPGVLMNFPDEPSPAAGFRMLLPGVHQWRIAGNCAVLRSRDGSAMLIDNGLCHWVAIEDRMAHHRQTIARMKQSLNISRIEMIFPTHYHGDHVENVPDLALTEGCEVVTVDAVADVLEEPERFNLACPLPWYDTKYPTVRVDRRMADGQTMTWHEYELTFFHLGGQTYNHGGMSTVVDGQRVAFVGDSLTHLGTGTASVLTYNDCEPEQRGWVYAIDRMLARKPDLLVCGHGIAVRDPMLLLQKQRMAWDRRLAEYRQLSAREDLRLFFDPFWDGVR